VGCYDQHERREKDVSPPSLWPHYERASASVGALFDVGSPGRGPKKQIATVEEFVEATGKDNTGWPFVWMVAVAKCDL
jgi:hypothetical protein